MSPFFRLVPDLLLPLALLGGFGCEGGHVSRTPPSQPAQPAAGASGQVLPTGSLSTARASHTATLLPNGKVLIAGGMEAAGATAELYDPARGSVAPAGRMRFDRSGGHAAALLPNGNVLLAGGWSGTAVTANAEVYDPSTSTFAATGVMSLPRSGYTATLLSTGKVLIVGGFDGKRRLESAELYDPRAGIFVPTGGMSQPRAEHAAALMADGRLLVTGGNQGSGQVLAGVEVYDPSTGTFHQTGDMTVIRHKHAAIALPDGRVLITGGSDARDGRGQHASAETYNPVSGTFSSVSNMNAKRFKLPQAVVLLGTGKVLVAGGNEQVEVYDPATNTFRRSEGSVGASLSFSTATLLPDGHVLIVGGYDSRIRPTAGAWVYRP